MVQRCKFSIELKNFPPDLSGEPNKFAFTPNLKLTVESCIMQAKQCLGNYKMAGAFRLLQQIGENLENNK